jgi:hypothetical protein
MIRAGERPESSARRALREFVAGATRPSRYAVITILLLNVSFISAFIVFVTPENMSSFLPSYLATSGSFDEHATGAAFRLEKEDSGRLLVVALGASAIREALDGEDLNAEFERRLARPVSVYGLATGSQSLYDSIAFAERIPSGSRGIVVLGMGPSRLTKPKSHLEEIIKAPRLGFRSDAVEEMARSSGIEVPGRTGLYPVDNIRFFAPRLTTLALRLVGNNPQSRRAHLYLEHPALGGKQWLKSSRGIAKRLERYEENARHNLELIDRLVAVVKARTRMEVVIVEHPLNPRFVREFATTEFVERHLQLVEAAARRLGIQHLDLNRLAGFGEPEFYDWCHLRNRAAIQRCATEVARGVARRLAESGPKERPR